MSNTYIVCYSLWEIEYQKIQPFLSLDHRHRHVNFTIEYLAGQYAYYASTSNDTVHKRAFKSELKFLKELGVQFNRDEALEFAVYFSGMLDHPQSKLAWY